jgi:transposase
VSEVRTTGETVRAVAERMGVSVSSAYLWMKGAADPGAPVFARVVPTRRSVQTSLDVAVGGATIRLQAGFDAELLRQVLAALSES